MSESTKAVFLSYASQDVEAAKRIGEALRVAAVEVWLDQEGGLVGGDAWDRKIREQIAACALFVPIISANTQSRKEGYFRLEWKLAAQRTHAMADGLPFLLPVVIDASHDAEALVPAEFKAVQWTKLPGGNAPAAFAERVQRILSGAAGAAGGRSPGHTPTLATAPQPRDDNFWIAVLPFKHRSTDAEVAALAEGMTEGVVTGLSRFSFFRVIANSSTARYAQAAVDIRSAGRELGARYLIECSLRQSGSKLRVAVQLVDTTSGAHLWAEHFDRHFSPDAVFDLQDDLVAHMVATIADANGVLVRSMADEVRNRDPLQLTPYEAILRVSGFGARYTPAEHAELRSVLERIVEQAPGQGECWGCLAFIYVVEYSDGFNARPDSLARASAAAQRAIANAPTNAFGHYVHARCLFHKGEIAAFRAAAERSLSLNPLDCVTMALLGWVFAFAGDWERGCALVKRADELNPHHPGWYWFPDCWNAYRQGDFRSALEAALKLNMPDYFMANVALAAIYAQLGQGDAAAKSLQDLRVARPDFAAIARTELGKYYTPDLVEQIIDGLRKAGLEIADPIKP